MSSLLVCDVVCRRRARALALALARDGIAPPRSAAIIRRVATDLRHRSPQSRHGLDRLGDRLRRAQGPSGPQQRVRAGPPRASSTPRRGGCSSAAAPRAAVPAPRDAPRVRRDAGELPDRRARTSRSARRGIAMARADLELVPIVDEARRARRRADRARARPPLHPRDARDLDPRGRPHPVAAVVEVLEGELVPARTSAALGPRLGALDGPALRQRHRGRRRRRRRQPRRRPAAARIELGAAAARALQRLRAVARRARRWPASAAPRSSSRRWTATSRGG